MNTEIRNLVAYFRAQLDEDEATARAAILDDDNGVWCSPHKGGIFGDRIEGAGIIIYDEGGHTAEQADHIARWDPARVLKDVEAKRRIIDWLETKTERAGSVSGREHRE